jgi:hypothetical protein
LLNTPCVAAASKFDAFCDRNGRPKIDDRSPGGGACCEMMSYGTYRPWYRPPCNPLPRCRFAAFVSDRDTSPSMSTPRTS